MAFIFLNESGDLGVDFTKQKTTKFFVVTFLFAEHKGPVEKCVGLVHRQLRKKYRNLSGVLHASKEESTQYNVL